MRLWIVALVGFDFDSPALQDSAQRTWFGDLGVSYHVGFYGFSLWLAGLTVVVGAAAIGFGAWVGRDRARAYYGLMLFLVGAVVGVFASQDLLLFYVFFEAMLIPIYVLVGVWGGPNRIAATITFVIYTMAGSLLMLASIVVFGLSQGTFSLDRLRDERQRLGLPRLPRRVRGEGAAAPVPRLAPHRLHRGAARGGRAALRRRLEGGGVRPRLDRAAAFPGAGRRLAHGRSSCWPRSGSSTARCSRSGSPTSAASSRTPRMAQMSLIVLGIFAANDLGLDGAVLHSVSHGLVSAAMFLLAAMLIQRTGTDRFAELGGMAKGRPAARDGRDGRRHAHARRPRLGELRRRVLDPRRRLRARAGATPQSAPPRSCSPPCTRCA